MADLVNKDSLVQLGQVRVLNDTRSDAAMTCEVRALPLI